MTHKKRLTHTSTCQSHVECFIRESTFGDFVEDVDVRWDPMFNPMIKVVTARSIINIIMTNRGIKTYT